MIPHIAYINPLSSYYYFRPYQAFHVRAQQDEVVTYGGDPRNPYANLLFQNLYAELEASWAEEEATNLGSPFEDEVPQGKDDEADTPETPAVDPPAPNFNTSHSPASRLRSVQQAKPINRSVVKQESTASVPNEQRRVFRMKK